MQITLVYPHQLFASHPAVQPGRDVALIEDPLFFGTDPQWPQRVHWRKLLLHRASMQAYADRLRSAGYTVLVQRHHEAADTTGHLELLLRAGYRSFHLSDPVDDVLERRLRAAITSHQALLHVVPTPMLLTPLNVIDEHLATGKNRPWRVL